MERGRSWAAKWLRTERPLLRQALAELLGTAVCSHALLSPVLLWLGDGCVAQSVLSGGGLGEALSIHLGWAVAVTLGVLVAGEASGAHLNPAISLAQFCLGNLSLLQLLVYQAAQYVGAFCGAGLVWWVYRSALDAFDGGVRAVEGPNATAGIFATYPQPFLSAGGGLLDQVCATALLSLAVLAITDPLNGATERKAVVPSLVGLTVLGVGLSYGFNCGYAINPARDLGPRTFTALAGWGKEVFSYRHFNWFWVPILGPYAGGVLGAGLYHLLVGLHLPAARLPDTPSHTPPASPSRPRADKKALATTGL